VAIKPDRIILFDIDRTADRLVAVGERGFVLYSDDAGRSWTAVPTPVTRTLTGVAFKDPRTGVAVGHGGSVVRTEDAGATWSQVTVEEEAGSDSLLDVQHLGGDHFIAYGAFGLYLDSADAGRTWARRTILGAAPAAEGGEAEADAGEEDAEYVDEGFDRHISRVTRVGPALLLVAESGTLARSDDEGATWTRLQSPYEGSWFGALTVDDGSVLVFGMRGNVYRTADLATWEQVPLGTTASLMGGAQLADGRILLVGNAGLLALSTDRGRSLELHWSPASKGFAQVVEADGRLIAVGESGVSVIDPAWLDVDADNPSGNASGDSPLRGQSPGTGPGPQKGTVEGRRGQPPSGTVPGPSP
jgi:photosystem II stability/assembly factor-like uncharacterized protein